MLSTSDILYMRRCLELADNGLGHVAPNPLVGAVVVCNGRVVGEGYHRRYGEKHAEANAIAAVKDKELLKRSTMYVSLEPCSHQGKQPPCCDLIIQHQIPKVVVATVDPNPLIAGRGIQRLRDAGVEVEVGLLQEDAQEQNRRFFTYQQKKRPYVILKWAESIDGFMDAKRNADEPPVWLTGATGQRLVHRWRTEEPAIMVGANTVVRDNPQLTARKWVGKNPLRVIFDRDLSLPIVSAIFSDDAKTLLFTHINQPDAKVYPPSVEVQSLVVREDLEEQILAELYKRNIQSVLVEGGANLLNRLISKDLWDEARVFTGNVKLIDGLKSPAVLGCLIGSVNMQDFNLKVFRNTKAQ